MRDEHRINDIVNKYTNLVSKVFECGRNAPFIREEESDQAQDLIQEIIQFCGLDLYELRQADLKTPFGNQSANYFADSMGTTLGKMASQLQDFNKAYARRKEALNATF